jgi:hypothetical protein
MEEVKGFIHLRSSTEKVERKINPKNIFRRIFGNCLIILFRLNCLFFAINIFQFMEQDHNHFLPRDDI